MAKQSTKVVGDAFERDCRDVLRLLGFDVYENQALAGRQTDLLACLKGPFSEQWFVVECKAEVDNAGSGQLDALFGRVTILRRSRPTAGGLLISKTGFSSRITEQAPQLGIQLCTLHDLQKKLVDIEDYNHSLIQSVEEPPAVGKDLRKLYIPPGVVAEGSSSAEALHEYVSRFLADSRAVMLTLLGDFGTGKTWFTRMLAYELAVAYRKQPGIARQPVRINLKDVAKALDLEGFLSHHFRTTLNRDDIRPTSFLHLNYHGRYVLIFDGFDEMATQSDWHITRENFSQILRAAEGRAKIILTCRTHYFKDLSSAEALHPGRGATDTSGGTELYQQIANKSGYQIAFLPGFSEEQVREYVYRARPGDAERIVSLIESRDVLQNIAACPIFLDMIVSTADHLPAECESVSVTDLYAAYTRIWFDREDWRLRYTREDKATLVQELAWLLWQGGSHTLHYSRLQAAIIPLLQHRRLTSREIEDADLEVRTATFLTRDNEGNYGFSHRSFLEYFLAKRLIGHFDVEALSIPMISPPVIAFFRDLAGPQKTAELAAEVLGQPYHPLSSENALLLWRSANSGPPPLAFHLESARLANVDLSGVNLVGAVMAGADLHKTNLSRSVLDDCNLSSARLDYADLTAAVARRANLRSVSATGASLNNADLDAPDLSNADLSSASYWQAHISLQQMSAVLYGGESVPAPTRFTAPFFFHAYSDEPLRAIECHWSTNLVALAMRNQILVLDGVTLRPRRVLWVTDHSLHTIAWSHDGKRLASGFGGRGVAVWDMECAAMRLLLRGHSASVSAIRWHPSGLRLVTGDVSGVVKSWDLQTGKPLTSIKIGSERITDVSYLDDNRIGALDGAGHLAICRGEDIRKLQIKAGSARFSRDKIVFSVEDEHFLCAVEDVEQVSADAARRVEQSVAKPSWLRWAKARGIVRARGKSGSRTLPWRLDRDLLGGPVQLSPNRTWAASRSTSRGWGAFAASQLELETAGVFSAMGEPSTPHDTIAITNLSTGERKLLATSSGTSRLAWTASSRQIILGATKTISVIDVASGEELQSRKSVANAGIQCLHWHPVLDRILVSGPDVGVFTWDFSSHCPERWQAPDGEPVRARWSATGRHFATAGRNEVVRLWLEARKPLSVALKAQHFCWHPLLDQIALPHDHKLDIWDAMPFRQRHVANIPEGNCPVVWSPDGQFVAIGSSAAIHIWNIGTERLRRTRDVGDVRCLSADPRGEFVAAGLANGRMVWTTWHAPTSAFQWPGNGCPVNDVAYSPDGNWLASASSGPILLWDRDFNCVASLHGHTGRVVSLAWRNCGSVLASAGDDGTVRIWRPFARPRPLFSLAFFGASGWAAVLEDNRFAGDAAGLKSLQFVNGWSIFPAAAFPALHDPEGVMQTMQAVVNGTRSA